MSQLYCSSFSQSDCSFINISRTVFVDFQYGNDRTAQVDSLNFQAKTIGHAFELIKEKRTNKSERWVVQVAPGDYPLTDRVPRNISLVGSGPSTRIIGRLWVRGSGEFTRFNLIGTMLPTILVRVPSRRPRTRIAFFQIEVTVSENSLQTTSEGEIRNVIRVEANSIEDVILFLQCDLEFDLSAFTFGENKFIQTLDAQVNFFSNFLRIDSSPNVPTTVLENLSALVDWELGTMLMRHLRETLTQPFIFFANLSPFLLLTKNNRIFFVREQIGSITQGGNQISVPPGVICYATAGDSVIHSIGSVTDLRAAPEEQRFIAVNRTGFVTTQALSSLNDFPGDVIGNSPITIMRSSPIAFMPNQSTSPEEPLIIRTPTNSHWFMTAANGNSLQSGNQAAGTTRVFVSVNNLSYEMTPNDSTIKVVQGAPPLPPQTVFVVSLLQVGPAHTGQEVTVMNYSTAPIIINRVETLQGGPFFLSRGQAQKFTFVDPPFWSLSS